MGRLRINTDTELRAESAQEQESVRSVVSEPAPQTVEPDKREESAAPEQIAESAGTRSEEAKEYHREIYPKGEVVLKLEHLTKRYGSRTSVDDVSLEVYSGEVFGFLGPNGAGKTTTIRMITGLHSITSGEVYVCGKSIKKDFKTAVSNIGGIIENPEMYKYMSGWDNLKYYASLYDGVTDDQIMDAVKLVRMQNRIHEKVKRYSLGMRQRVGIAQSLLHNPRLLMLDEPTNGLDPAGIHEMRDFLKMLAHDFGIAVFISSHILTEMQLMCDRVGIVNLGKLVAVKTMEEWMSTAGNGVKIKLITDDTARAVRVLADKFAIAPERNGNILIFNTTKDVLGGISVALASENVGVLNLTQGEKSLEETFLELTSAAGTEVF